MKIKLLMKSAQNKLLGVKLRLFRSRVKYKI